MCHAGSTGSQGSSINGLLMIGLVTCLVQENVIGLSRFQVPTSYGMLLSDPFMIAVLVFA
jgi:hypothetical protein